MPNYGPQSAPYRWIRTPLPSTRFLEPYPRIELNSTELQLLQPCSQSTSWRWRAWPITRRVTGSTWCRSAQFSLFRLLWTPHWKAWARLKEIGTRWNQRCLIFQCVPIYLKGRSFTSVFIFSWGTPLKRQSVLLHTHTHTHTRPVALQNCRFWCTHIAETAHATVTKYSVHVASGSGSTCSGGVAIGYVLPVRWLTSCLPTKSARRRRCSRAYTQSDSPRGSTERRGRSLLSTVVALSLIVGSWCSCRSSCCRRPTTYFRSTTTSLSANW